MSDPRLHKIEGCVRDSFKQVGDWLDSAFSSLFGTPTETPYSISIQLNQNRRHNNKCDCTHCCGYCSVAKTQCPNSTIAQNLRSRTVRSKGSRQ